MCDLVKFRQPYQEGLHFGIHVGCDCTCSTQRVCVLMFLFFVSFYCTTSLITDYKYTYVTINGL